MEELYNIFNSPTFRLGRPPSFLDGTATIMDLAGHYFLYNVSRTGEEADALALRSDFLAVAGDMRRSFEQVKKAR